MSDHRNDAPSTRQKKQQAKAGAEVLRQKAGWDPSAFQRQSPKDQLRALEQQEKSAEAYSSSVVCPACLQARAQLQDETALCQTHLAEAMGL
jgi:xanthine dehydrogenase iron-sulfur cluster and FAD-binding subunit A